MTGDAIRRSRAERERWGSIHLHLLTSDGRLWRLVPFAILGRGIAIIPGHDLPEATRKTNAAVKAAAAQINPF